MNNKGELHAPSLSRFFNTGTDPVGRLGVVSLRSVFI